MLDGYKLIPDDVTFFGAKRYDQAVTDPNIVFFGAPSSLGSSFVACENGPFFLRRLSQAYVWQGQTPDLVDLRNKDLRFEGLYDAGNLLPEGNLGGYCEELYKFASQLPDCAIPICVGGDHSISLPLIKAIADKIPDLKVIVLDHHLDIQYWDFELDTLFNTNVISHVARLLGNRAIAHLGVAPVQTVDSDKRDWFTELLDVTGVQITHMCAEIWDDESILKKIGRNQHLYVSLDVDVLPRSEMSATSYPSDVGLNTNRVCQLLRLIASSNVIVGCDITEFAANRDDRREKTLADAGRACTLLLELVQASIISRKNSERFAKLSENHEVRR